MTVLSGVSDAEAVATPVILVDSEALADRVIEIVGDLLLVTDSERERERSSESDRVPVAVAVALSDTVSEAESEAEGVAVPRVTETLTLRDAVASTVSDAETVRESSDVTLPEIERLSELVGVPREMDAVGDDVSVTEKLMDAVSVGEKRLFVMERVADADGDTLRDADGSSLPECDGEMLLVGVP